MATFGVPVVPDVQIMAATSSSRRGERTAGSEWRE
jgi:hypothetical protein